MRSLLLAMLLPTVCLAEPTVRVLTPGSVCRGGRATLLFQGEQVDRPLGVWTSLPAQKLRFVGTKSCTPDRCELEVEAATDCPIGIYGLRLATEDGLSNLQLFLVDDIPLQEKPGKPQKTFPIAIAGTFREAEVDRYQIEVSAHQMLSFDVVSSRLGTDADPLLTIYDADGTVVVQRDNDPGIFFDCCFEHTFERAGVYSVEVRDSRYLGAPHWQYVLRMGNFPAVRVAVPSAIKPGETTAVRLPSLTNLVCNLQPSTIGDETTLFQAIKRETDNASNWVPILVSSRDQVIEVEPNDKPEQATPAAGNDVLVHGTLEAQNDRDYFAFELKKGDRLFVRAETKLLQSAADVELVVFEPMGREIQRVDDINLPGGALDEASLTFNADKDGLFYVMVREATGAHGAELGYRLDVRPAEPRVHIFAEHSAFTVPKDNYQSLPLSVSRTDFNGPIELFLVGAPQGVRLEPTTIPEGANNLLCKLYVPATVAQGLYCFGVAGTGQLGEKAIRASFSTQPLVDKQLINVDLIRHALRDNQRWLPPSVKDRLALQVTAATPFTVEPAESLVTLPRYQQAALPLRVDRDNEFKAPISFRAVGGGQFGDEAEGRRQVFARLPVANATDVSPAITFHSRSQANDATDRIDLFASSLQAGRNITLVRSITLQVKPAFELEMEPKQLVLEPGATAKVTLTVRRLPSFNGPVTISPSAFTGVMVPTALTIPADQTSVVIEVAVQPNCQPRRDRLRFPSTGQVGAFQEEPRPAELDVEIKLPTIAK